METLQRTGTPDQQVRPALRRPHAAEPEYRLTRLTAAVTGFRVGGFHFGYSRHARPELLAQLDALLSQIGEIRDLAEHAREVLLRPPPEEGTPGFTE
jgi:hypothetical protein